MTQPEGRKRGRSFPTQWCWSRGAAIVIFFNLPFVCKLNGCRVEVDLGLSLLVQKRPNVHFPLFFLFPPSPLFFCWAQLDENLGDFRQTLITLDLVLVRRIGGNLVKSRPKRRSQDLRRLKKRSHIKFLGSGRGRWFQFQWFNCLTPHALLHTNCPRFFPTPFILAEYRRNTHTIGSGCTTRTRSPVYSVQYTILGQYPLMGHIHCASRIFSLWSPKENRKTKIDRLYIRGALVRHLPLCLVIVENSINLIRTKQPQSTPNNEI